VEKPLAAVPGGDVETGKLSLRCSLHLVCHLPAFANMADPALKAEPKPVLLTEGGIRALIASILVYWGILAAISPVTNSDSQVYNLARLSVAERVGFWQTTAWNSIRQVIFPWTFDSVHYPFLKLGWGFAIPSFLVLLGLLIIIYRLVANRCGTTVGYWSVLTILAMPTVMLQATTTKNDLIVVFGVACWLYSLLRFRQKPKRFYLFAAALSVAFTIGSKTSALPIGTILIVATGWFFRKQLSHLLWFALFCGPLLLLFGSIETYVLSWQNYHDPVGPKQFVNAHINQDGFRGAIANFIRYYFANLSTGIDGIDCRSGFPRILEENCRWLLGSLGLSNAGCRPDFSDANMPFLKDGSDSGSDYGLVGCLALVVSSFLIWKPKLRSLPWALNLVGFSFLALTCCTVSWMPWNARYFPGTFILFGMSLTITVFGPANNRRWMQLAFGLIVIWSAISLPLHCGQRKPLDVWNSFFARTELSLKQRPEIKQVLDDVLTLRRNRADKWFLVSSENSWTLPFLGQSGMDWDLTPQWDQLFKSQSASKETDPSFALVLNSPLPPNLPFEIVKSYPSSTFILKILPDAPKQL
jgi:hypothetical protein